MNKNILMRKKLKENPDYTSTRDEYYTTPETAQRMVVGVKLSQFAGKSVYCNCDTEKSEIYKLAKANFKTWQLKSLVATGYVKGGKGVKVTYDGEKEVISQLEGDGSYDSPDCLEILEHSDIVMTNPPFSKLGKFIPFVLERNKDFVIITNMMALMYKSTIKYSLAGKFNLCSNFTGGATFTRPNGDIATLKCVAATTLDVFDICKKQPSKTLQQLTDENKIYKEDTDGIYEVKYISNLPIDYYGEIYCTTSILFMKHLRNKYEIVKMADKTITVNGKNRFRRVLVKRKLV